jgi:hypothetical protein
MYASFLRISDALHLGIFHQPPKYPVLQQAPSNKAPPVAPEYFRNSLLLIPLIGLSLFTLVELLDASFMVFLYLIDRSE